MKDKVWCVFVQLVLTDGTDGDEAGYKVEAPTKEEAAKRFKKEWKVKGRIIRIVLWETILSPEQERELMKQFADKLDGMEIKERIKFK